jgi:carbon-monoxide dehydrogenase small subunit
MKKLSLTVNGKKRTVSCHPLSRLLDVLREEFELTGTKEGCGEGECGACSVMLDGQLVNSCLVPVLQAQGKKVLTVEGLAKKSLTPLQKSFMKCGGAQCGICTPGMLIAAHALTKKNKKPTKKEIREGLGGNLCRCTGYGPIIESIQSIGSES